MADILDVYKPEFWAQETLLQLFPRLMMANIVHRDFENIVSSEGDTVNTRIPGTFSALTVNPDSFASVKPTATNVQVVMNLWKHVTFEIGDKEKSLTMKSVYEEFLPNAAQAIALDIEDALMGLYADIGNHIGAPSTALDSVEEIGTNVKQKFDELYIPRDNRYVILSPAAENYYNRIFYQAYVSGSSQQQTTGELGQKFGMQYLAADRLPAHTAGTTAAETGIQIDHSANSGVLAAGTTTLVLKGAGTSTTLTRGDILVIDSDTDKSYSVLEAKTASSGGAVTVTIAWPGTLRDYADSDAVDVLASHNNCLAFHKQAFALVSRPLAAPGYPGAAVSVQNYNGIGLRAAVWYEPKDKRSYVCLDILYGVKTLDSRKAFRVIY